MLTIGVENGEESEMKKKKTNFERLSQLVLANCSLLLEPSRDKALPPASLQRCSPRVLEQLLHSQGLSDLLRAVLKLSEPFLRLLQLPHLSSLVNEGWTLNNRRLQMN